MTSINTKTLKSLRDRYAWRIVFIGNGGESIRGYDRLIRDRDEARSAARLADGCGLRYGARARRVRISQDEFDRLFKAA